MEHTYNIQQTSPPNLQEWCQCVYRCTDSAAYVTSNVFTSRVTHNHETFLGQRALGARPRLPSQGRCKHSVSLPYGTFPSRPRLGGRDRDSHHTARGPHSPSGGRCSYAHNAYSLPVHSPYGTSPQSRPVGQRSVFIATRKKRYFTCLPGRRCVVTEL